MPVVLPYSVRSKQNDQQGFTLIELLVVIVIIGILLSVILPRAHRATNDARFSMIRQHASEIGSHIVQWGQDKVSVQYESGNFTLLNVLTEEISGEQADEAGFSSQPLADHYTGHENYEQVSSGVPGDFELKNPFNNRSYFHSFNNDENAQGETIAPSVKPGLLYLASGLDESPDGRNLRTFYFLITGQPDGTTPRWHGNMGLEGEGMRHGMFVVRVPEYRINF